MNPRDTDVTETNAGKDAGATRKGNRYVPWLTSFLLTLASASPAATSVSDLRCEYLENPLGIDVRQPRLSWIMNSSERGGRQAAYQILVASDPEKLNRNQGDLWDSGKMDSDETRVTFKGRIGSQDQCFWKVRVWDKGEHVSAWSKPAFWTMGLLDRAEWKGQWIGLEGETKTNYLAGTSWIWFPEGDPTNSAPTGSRYFRRTFVVPRDREIRRAHFLITADSECKAFFNGRDIGGRNNYRYVKDNDVTFRLEPGTNFIAVMAKNNGPEPKAAGLIALLQIEFEKGEPLLIPTDELWKAADQEPAGWNNANFDDSNWSPAKNLGPVGIEPWNNVRTTDDRRLPARYLRKEFSLEKKPKRAVVYFSGLGVSELYLNGRKVGDHVLAPGLTEYPKRVFYETFDVTQDLKAGHNALGVILGNGRYYAPRSRIYAGMPNYGFPKLLLHLRMERADGTVSEIVSDESWRLSSDGPITANNEYDGEDYDARKEFGDWANVGFDDSKWSFAEPVSAPGGTNFPSSQPAEDGNPAAILSSQMIEPIRVTQTLIPVAVTEPKPGVYVFDLGQNMVGWCALRVSGPTGTKVSLRFAETLSPDGTLYLANLRGALVTDTYTLSGKGPENWEPRFVYHGFRYVEVTGYPGRPPLNAINGRVVHDDLRRTGEFVCSNDLLNRIYTNIVWGIRGNYRSIPTDCPQRDERQGWLGDRSEESRGEAFIFDTAALYSKWLQDMADSQKPSGSVPDVCPGYWPIYSDDVSWPSSLVIIPGALQKQFGDATAIHKSYAAAKKWVDYMTTFLTNGIISKDSYGDWCVPPEDPALIHSADPNRRTDTNLIATAYFYHDLRLMESYANLLSNREDAGRFRELAEKIGTALNEKFLDREAGQYDNGTQSSCVLPLAFGLVPDDQRDRVFKHLVSKILNETHGHIGTGLIGGQYLNRVLTDHGRADLAYTIAGQKNYPSWGYMVGKGATTIWELWNGDTADPAMNSGNHVMLVGDLVIWFYENLAGIKSDPATPGFKHIIMRPETPGDLSFVRASYRSVHGRIGSHWKRKGPEFDWEIEIPANVTATVYLPAGKGDRITESKQPITHRQGISGVRFEGDRAVLDLGSGTYEFHVSRAH